MCRKLFLQHTKTKQNKQKKKNAKGREIPNITKETIVGEGGNCVVVARDGQNHHMLMILKSNSNYLNEGDLKSKSF